MTDGTQPPKFWSGFRSGFMTEFRKEHPFKVFLGGAAMGGLAVYWAMAVVRVCQ